MVNNILISGGQDFLDPHFCESLLANGHELLRVGNFFKGSKANVKHTTNTSAHGAINMVGLAMWVETKILQASTSEVYGHSQIHPKPESYGGSVNSNDLCSCYEEGKRFSETLFSDYWRQHAVGIKEARIFNTYPPRMHPEDFMNATERCTVAGLRGR